RVAALRDSSPQPPPASSGRRGRAALLDRREHALGGQRQLAQRCPAGVVDRIGDRRGGGDQDNLADRANVPIPNAAGGQVDARERRDVRDGGDLVVTEVRLD